MNVKNTTRLLLIISAALVTWCFLPGGLTKPVFGQVKEAGQLSNKRYTDPKGYFQIVPPSEWRIKEYPQDSRGKVAFFSPDAGVELRILVNAVDFSTIDKLLDFCRSTQKRLGIPMKIEKFDFHGYPAVRRSFELRGTRFLYVDFLVGKVDHNLAYGAPPAKYEQYLPVVLQSMESYEPVFREIDDKEKLEHIVAKKLRLARLMVEAGRYDLALEYVREGLTLAPQNAELLKLKQEVDAQFKKTDEKKPATPGKERFHWRKYGFSFTIPEKVNVYTAENPGPMAARISAATPIWLVNADVPSERINVKVTEGEDATFADLRREMPGILAGFTRIPQYEKVSVQEINIGKKQDNMAYEHIHLLRQTPTKKLRQILFVHKGNAFCFTCSTSVERYETANKEFFDTIFSSMEFE